ncbi:hypothetical protein BCV70DRAFT_199109 [Testicularia cyperi]|uniref:Small ribosomal subunit protein mS29 n=1 Tax=Testicularia cyperi TaxID=1882483 RepID=A0A317XUT3_9BASI|nr:hypothetical protein BCV70DRAFT_199109 [Testicularia cyperi]
MATYRSFGALRTVAGQASSSLASTSSSAAAAQQIRSFSLTASASAAAKKAPAVKKKAVVKKKAGISGPRSTGGKRKGGVDSSSSLSRNSEFHLESPDMSHLQPLHAENLTQAAIGHTFAYTDATLAAFKAFGLPQELQRELDAQPKPRTLVRQQTLDLLDRFDAAAKGGKSDKVVLEGNNGSGKSTLVAQSIAYALDEGWVVISIPRSINLINSSTLYTYSSSHQAYVQPEATKDLLDAIAKVNGAALKKIKTTEAATIDGNELAQGTPLDAVIKRGVDESASASARHTVFELVIKTLAQQTECPVLVAVDDVQSLFRTSLYKDPDFTPLEAYELGLPRTLLSLFTSASASDKPSPFSLKKGIVLGAISTSHTEFLTPPELAIALADSSSQPPIVSQAINAYTKLAPQHLENAKLALANTKVLNTSNPLSRSEAAALFAQLKQERRYWSPVNDELFLAKLVETNGNARLFSKSLVSTLL